jgi:hypothetical protein
LLAPFVRDVLVKKSSCETQHFVHGALLWLWSANPQSLQRAGWSAIIATSATRTIIPASRVRNKDFD